MKRLLGLLLFGIGLGLLLGLIFCKTIISLLAAAICLLLGYCLFCCR